MSDDPDRPAWAANFFVGVPAPAGAITVLLPIYAAFLGLPRSTVPDLADARLHARIAALMVSRLPVFSGKRIGKRVPPDMVGPLVIVMVLFVALLIAYPWMILTVGTLVYLASLPFGWLSYRAYERRSREGKAEAAPLPPATSPVAASIVPSRPRTKTVRRASIEPYRGLRLAARDQMRLTRRSFLASTSVAQRRLRLLLPRRARRMRRS